MEFDRLERIVDGQKEKELSDMEERRNSLKRIKADLLARIAAMWANKENEPVIRSDFKLRVRPSNTSVEFSDIFPFSSVGAYFEEEAENILQRIGRRFPGRNLIMEFLLFPYEHGSKKLRFDAVFKPVGGIVAARPAAVENTTALVRVPVSPEPTEVAKKQTRVRNRVVKAGVPLAADIPAAVSVTKASSASAPKAAETAPTPESLNLPSKKEIKSTYEQLKELIRQTAFRNG